MDAGVGRSQKRLFPLRGKEHNESAAYGSVRDISKLTFSGQILYAIPLSTLESYLFQKSSSI